MSFTELILADNTAGITSKGDSHHGVSLLKALTLCYTRNAKSILHKKSGGIRESCGFDTFSDVAWILCYSVEPRLTDTPQQWIPTI